jgi:gamma-glutamyltranspeptidase / glutathione hydrolase
MTIQEAVDTGRFHNQWLPELTSFEKNSIDSLTLQKLMEMGQTFNKRDLIGSVNAIMILPDGKKGGGADKRGNNSACGY